MSALRHQLKFPSFIWAGRIKAVIRTAVSEWPRRRHNCPFPLTAARAQARLSILDPVTCCLAIWLPVGFLPAAAAEAVAPVVVVPAISSQKAVPYAAFVAEAARRFAIPENWIRAVMQVESNGNADAVSPQGALGLMQVRPGTWVELSVRYDLGLDSFDPHDNIVAGTAYLREMLDRFGTEGFLAAYNAGPRRYEDHLATGRPLPGETQAYIKTLASLIKIEQRDPGRSAARHAIQWQHGPVFVELSNSASGGVLSASTAHPFESSSPLSSRHSLALKPSSAGLFVQRPSEVESQ